MEEPSLDDTPSEEAIEAAVGRYRARAASAAVAAPSVELIRVAWAEVPLRPTLVEGLDTARIVLRDDDEHAGPSLEIVQIGENAAWIVVGAGRDGRATFVRIVQELVEEERREAVEGRRFGRWLLRAALTLAVGRAPAVGGTATEKLLSHHVVSLSGRKPARVTVRGVEFEPGASLSAVEWGALEQRLEQELTGGQGPLAAYVRNMIEHTPLARLGEPVGAEARAAVERALTETPPPARARSLRQRIRWIEALDGPRPLEWDEDAFALALVAYALEPSPAGLANLEGPLARWLGEDGVAEMAGQLAEACASAGRPLDRAALIRALVMVHLAIRGRVRTTTGFDTFSQHSFLLSELIAHLPERPRPIDLGPPLSLYDEAMFYVSPATVFGPGMYLAATMGAECLARLVGAAVLGAPVSGTSGRLLQVLRWVAARVAVSADDPVERRSHIEALRLVAPTAPLRELTSRLLHPVLGPATDEGGVRRRSERTATLRATRTQLLNRAERSAPMTLPWALLTWVVLGPRGPGEPT